MRSMLLAAVAIGLAASAAPASATCVLNKLGELPVTMDGLTPTVPVKINGGDARMIVDSGAFFSLLTPQAAARLKLKVGNIRRNNKSSDQGYTVAIGGLGGAEDPGLASTDNFTIFGYTFHRADFFVASPQLAPIDGLIGDNLLSFGDLEFDLADGAVRLFQPTGCGDSNVLAYWAGQSGQFGSVPMPPAVAPNFKIVVQVQVNGREMKAIVDSGAGRSYVTRAAAKAAGVSVDSAGVRSGGLGVGIGARAFDTWTATFQSFQIGDEAVRNTVLEIGDGDLAEGADMLLGADFLLSHRVYVANSQHKFYFSYIGGPVFDLGRAAPAAPPAGAPPPTLVPPKDQAMDAAALSRRGAAFAAREDYAAAIADFTRAAALEPDSAQPLYDRGMAHWRNGEDGGALADFDAAIKLDPRHVEALLARGEIRLQLKDDAGAAADFGAAVRIQPDDRVTVGRRYSEYGHFELAIAQYDQWFADNPKARAPSVLNDRCWSRAMWGQQLDKALIDCNASVGMAPGNPAPLDSRGYVFLRLGQFEKAPTDFDGALRVNPKQASSLYGRGVAELRLGRKAEGDADIAAAATLDPTLPSRFKQYGFAP